MLKKKIWAEALLTAQKITFESKHWWWVIPPDGEVYFTRGHPAVRVLLAAGITFPRKRAIVAE